MDWTPVEEPLPSSLPKALSVSETSEAGGEGLLRWVGRVGASVSEEEGDASSCAGWGGLVDLRIAVREGGLQRGAFVLWAYWWFEVVGSWVEDSWKCVA